MHTHVTCCWRNHMPDQAVSELSGNKNDACVFAVGCSSLLCLQQIPLRMKTWSVSHWHYQGKVDQVLVFSATRCSNTQSMKVVNCDWEDFFPSGSSLSAFWHQWLNFKWTNFSLIILLFDPAPPGSCNFAIVEINADPTTSGRMPHDLATK